MYYLESDFIFIKNKVEYLDQNFRESVSQLQHHNESIFPLNDRDILKRRAFDLFGITNFTLHGSLFPKL